jgi:hypothetical protein
MNMGNGGACLGSLDSGVGNFFGGDGYVRMFADRVPGAWYGTNDDDFTVHSFIQLPSGEKP